MFVKLSSIFKSFYLYLVNIRSRTSSKNHNNVVFLLSFPSTSKILLESLYNEWGENLIICYTANASNLAFDYKEKGCSIYQVNSFKTLILKIVPLVTGAKVVLCDNYFAFLGGIQPSNTREIVQIWHANGAIKSFGLSANYTKSRSYLDEQRYIDVYKKITKYILSSNHMKDVFERNYQVEIKILPFGYPLTDYYFDKDWIHQKKKKFKEHFPTDKKILLYAPTYRERGSQKKNQFHSIVPELQEEWLVFVKPHPHEELKYRDLNEDNSMIFDFKGLSLDEILPFVDCLITDYSSIPFEYSIANPNGKMVFYCYDFEEYNEIVGIEKDFLKWAPGEIVFDEESLFEAINKNNVLTFDSFNEDWNQFVKGTSRTQILDWIRDKNES